MPLKLSADRRTAVISPVVSRAADETAAISVLISVARRAACDKLLLISAAAADC
jgi:hypothetical protein